MQTVRFATILLPLVVLGCAKQNTLGTSSATSAMRSAEVSGAQELPQASLAPAARRGAARGGREPSNADGEEEMAKSMLTRAAADAELALLLSHEKTESKDAADAALAKVAALRAAK